LKLLLLVNEEFISEAQIFTDVYKSDA